MFKDKRKCPNLEVWKCYVFYVRALIDNYVRKNNMHNIIIINLQLNYYNSTCLDPLRVISRECTSIMCTKPRFWATKLGFDDVRWLEAYSRDIN
jgi:hypothetical protein